MQRRWKAIGLPAALALIFAPLYASAAEIPGPASGSFWSLRPQVDAQERIALVDQAIGRASAHNAYSAHTLTQLLTEHGSLRVAGGTSQEYFVNPEPSSVLVWATSAMGIVAAGYGYRRRSN